MDEVAEAYRNQILSKSVLPPINSSNPFGGNEKIAPIVLDNRPHTSNPFLDNLGKKDSWTKSLLAIDKALDTKTNIHP